MRQQKYQGGDVSSAKVEVGKRVMADGMNGIVDGINKAITEIRINVTGNDAPGLDVQQPSHVNKTQLLVYSNCKHVLMQSIRLIIHYTV